MVLSWPQVVSSHTCTDQLSGVLCSSLLSGPLSQELWLPQSPQAPSPSPRPGCPVDSAWAPSPCCITLFVSCLPRITLFGLLMFSFLKVLFYVFPLDFWLSRVQGLIWSVLLHCGQLWETDIGMFEESPWLEFLKQALQSHCWSVEQNGFLREGFLNFVLILVESHESSAFCSMSDTHGA